MKIFSIALFLVSFNALAIDFTKVTGSFDIDDQKVPEEKVHVTAVSASFGTEKMSSSDRRPASVEATQVPSAEVTEVSGTFR
jgi:polyisoprenoid-binding protein YceI